MLSTPQYRKVHHQQALLTYTIHPYRRDGSAPLQYSGGVADISEEDLVITETPRTGWSVASHAGESLALDLALTPELIQSGLVREVIRAIQEERKKIGLDVSDRITVNWNAPDQVANAIKTAVAEISAEVLATTMVQDKTQSSDGNELGLWLNLVKN